MARFPRLLLSCISASLSLLHTFQPISKDSRNDEESEFSCRNKHASSIERWKKNPWCANDPIFHRVAACISLHCISQLPVERFSNSFWIILSNYRICPRVHACISDDETYIYVRVSWKGSSVQASKTLDTCTTIQSDDVPDTRSELINFRRTFPINFHGKQLINEGCIIEGFEDTTLKFSKNDDPSNIW